MRIGTTERIPSAEATPSGTVNRLSSRLRCRPDAASQTGATPLLDSGADAKNESFERAAARQQNIMAQQSRDSTVEEHASPLAPCPAKHVEPAGEPESYPRFRNIAVARNRSGCGRRGLIVVCRRRTRAPVEIHDVQLVSKRLHHLGGNRRGRCRPLRKVATPRTAFAGTVIDLSKLPLFSHTGTKLLQTNRKLTRIVPSKAWPQYRTT